MWFDWLIFESSIWRALDNQFQNIFYLVISQILGPRNIGTICLESFNRQGIHTSYLADAVPGPGNRVSQPWFRRQIFSRIIWTTASEKIDYSVRTESTKNSNFIFLGFRCEIDSKKSSLKSANGSGIPV